ncbi:MAG TPA: AAA family ATPase [Candidatus Dormibacteraeota bacterium]|nr:AAA family ATPase [Candidatus Dormibacteraeota bacterium]
MWEREAVLEATRGLLDAARSGGGGTLLIAAEAGLGKTSVLDHARRVAGAGIRTGSARGDPMESALPFGLFGQALAGLGGPDLGVGTETPPAPPGATFFQVLRWIEEEAPRPLLLALDDLHWADDDSLALLAFLCRRIGGKGVAVIGTLRPWPPRAREVAGGLVAGGHATLERLLPLSEASARTLLATQGGGPPEPVVAQALSLCNGNCLLLEQVARSLRRGEELPDPAEGSRPWISDELLLARFAALPEPALRLARAASALGVHFRTGPAVEVARLDEAGVDDALEALLRSGLLRGAGGSTLEFVHPLFRHALYEDMEPPVRARLHARAVAVLAGQGLDAEAAQHAVRADLVGDPVALAVLERAGRAALRGGALQTAVRHLEAALDLSGERPSAELLGVLGEALLASGRPAAAIETQERLLADPELPAAARVAGLRLLGHAHWAAGDTHQAALQLDAAAGLAERSGLAGAAVEVLLDRAQTSWLTTGPGDSLRAVTRARTLAEDVDESLRTRVGAAWGFVSFLCGDPAGLEATAAAAAVVESDLGAHLSELTSSWGALMTHGHVGKYAERLTEARRVLQIALGAAERLGAVEAIAAVALSLGDTLIRAGLLGDAQLLAERGMAIGELVPFMAPFGAAGGAVLAQLTGRLEESEAMCALVEAQPRPPAIALLWVHHVRGRRALVEGRAEAASAWFIRAEELTHRAGIGEPCVVPWARHAVAAHTGAGRLADAQRVLGWLEECATRLPCRWPRIAAACGHAHLAEARGDVATAERHLQNALALHDEVGLPLEHAQTLIERGRLLRRVGRPAAARAPLASALHLAEEAGASWLAAQARAELQVAGGRRHRSLDEPERLTAQETRVADLVCAGRSNQQIAQHLSVSVNTVETHLKHVYAKLGVRSRVELMGRRGGDPKHHGVP